MLKPEADRRSSRFYKKRLMTPALYVVAEAAEDLGALGVVEAGPVLLGLLRIPRNQYGRQRGPGCVADAAVLNGLLDALDDPA